MPEMKVFVGNNHTFLFSDRGLGEPTLIGYIYKYETNEENVEYWDSLNPEEQEALVDEAEEKKMDLRLLIKNKQRG